MQVLTDKTKAARDFYNTLTTIEARKVTAIVTSNKKLEETAQNQPFKVAGIALYPALFNSCSHADSCMKTCIAFTGLAQVMKGSKGYELSTVDKAMLKRLWLFNNKPEYFYKRAKTELEVISEFGETLVMLRETTSECIDMEKFDKLKSVMTYGYFKNPEKLTDKKTTLPIYSWNSKSTKQELVKAQKNDIPVAVVVPKKLFNKIMKPVKKQNTLLSREYSRVVLHNGDTSDLNSHNGYVCGKVNIHLLSEKTSRYSKVIGKTNFLDSWKNLFHTLWTMTTDTEIENIIENAVRDF